MMETPEQIELEKLKRPQLVEVAAHYNVTVVHNMSNVALVAAIKAAAGYKSAGAPDERLEGELSGEQPQQDEAPQQPAIQYVMMRRTTDGDGPHPIHPDEVENYIAGNWEVVVDERRVQ